MRTYDENSSYEEPSIDSFTGELERQPVKGVGAKMKLLLNWSIEKRGGKLFANLPKQLKALKNARLADIPPGKLQERWEEMETEKFWIENGFDWMDVVNNFDKRP